MLTGKGLALISSGSYDGLSYEIYDYKPEYISVLEEAAKEISGFNLLEFLKLENVSVRDFHGQKLYECSEKIFTIKDDAKLYIAEDLKLYLFSSDENHGLRSFPQTKKCL